MKPRPPQSLPLAAPLGLRLVAWHRRYRLGGLTRREVRCAPTRIVDAADGQVAFGGLSLLYMLGVMIGALLIFLGLVAIAQEPVVALFLLPAGGALICFAIGAWRRSWQSVVRSNMHGRIVTEWHEVQRIALGDGRGRQTGELIQAVFTLHVPPPDGDRRLAGLALALAFFGFARPRRWYLEVDLVDEDLPDRDSCFPVAIRAKTFLGPGELPPAEPLTTDSAA